LVSEKLTKVGATIEAKIIRENKKVIIVLLMGFIKNKGTKLGMVFLVFFKKYEGFLFHQQ
jgi:hypothetical protein